MFAYMEMESLEDVERIYIESQLYRLKALDHERFVEAWKLRNLGLALQELMQVMREIKANYNPLQPRDEDGRWTLIGAVPGSEEVDYVKTILPPSGERLNQANIFVGGGGDRTFTGPVITSDSLKKYSYGDNYYTTADVNERDIIRFIETLPKTRRVNLIGHSYGGDSAVLVAERLPERIHTLITIDPVSHLNIIDYDSIRQNTKLWVNVNAVSEGTSFGDFLRGVGGAWNDEPEGRADIHIRAPFVHEAFDQMMRYHQSERTLSPQSLLNR